MRKKIWKMNEIGLKTFCDGEIRVQIADGEGSWKAKSYIYDPDSGIGYVSVYNTKNPEDVRLIATYAEKGTSLRIWLRD